MSIAATVNAAPLTVFVPGAADAPPATAPATLSAWIPAMVAEAGIKWPLAMTAAAYGQTVQPDADSGRELAPGQDVKGRLWDVLWMTRHAIRSSLSGGPTVRVSLTVRDDVPAGSGLAGRLRTRELVCSSGAGDNGEPVLTLMLPGED